MIVAIPITIVLNPKPLNPKPSNSKQGDLKTPHHGRWSESVQAWTGAFQKEYLLGCSRQASCNLIITGCYHVRDLGLILELSAVMLEIKYPCTSKLLGPRRSVLGPTHVLKLPRKLSSAVLGEGCKLFCFEIIWVIVFKEGVALFFFQVYMGFMQMPRP